MCKQKCKRCGRSILQKTASKYHGYSRQCLAKLTKERNSNTGKVLETLDLLSQSLLGLTLMEAVSLC